MPRAAAPCLMRMNAPGCELPVWAHLGVKGPARPIVVARPQFGTLFVGTRSSRIDSKRKEKTKSAEGHHAFALRSIIRVVNGAGRGELCERNQKKTNSKRSKSPAAKARGSDYDLNAYSSCCTSGLRICLIASRTLALHFSDGPTAQQRSPSSGF